MTSNSRPRARAMVLAAGFGSRLGALSQLVPKPLLPISGVSLLEWTVALLRHHGIVDIVINVHHLGGLIQERLGDGRAFGVDIRYSVERDILGTGGALVQARPWLDDGGETPIVVMNAKLMLDLDLPTMIERHLQSGAQATMLLRPDAEGIWGAGFRLDSGRNIVEFLGEGDPSAGAAPHMFCGVQVIQPDFLDRIPPQGQQCVVRTAYRELFTRAPERLFGEFHDDYWWEHSTPERYRQGVAQILAGRARLDHAPGPWSGVDPSARVDPSAEISEQAWVGARAEIAADVRIGAGVQVGADAVVEAGVQLARCVVWDGARVTQSAEDEVIVGGVSEATGE